MTIHQKSDVTNQSHRQIALIAGIGLLVRSYPQEVG